jgi:hypothetical protein
MPAGKLATAPAATARSVIYGAGAAGRAALALLGRDRGRQVVAFVDGDARKHGAFVEGVRVVAPDALMGGWFDQVVVASGAWREIAATLARLGVPARSIALYRAGEDRLVPLVPERADSGAPCILVLTDDCVSPGHGTGAVLIRHLVSYPADRLTHAYLRRKGDPVWPNSFALSMADKGEAGSLRPQEVAARLAATGQTPDLIYANVFGEPGLEALAALLDALGPVPVIQHFHDWLYADREGFDRTLRGVAPRIAEFWAITDSLAREIGTIVGRDVRTMNTFKCEIAPKYKCEHRDLDERFRVVMLGNSHMPWVLHHVRNVWRAIQAQVPGLGPIQWFGYPTSMLYVKEAGVELEPEIEYCGYLNSRLLHEQLCAADLALIPFNIADVPEYHYAAFSVPSRITEFLNAGLPIFAAAGRGTETHRFLAEHRIGISATIGDEQGFALSLIDLMRDTGKRLALSKAGRAFAERHCDVQMYRQSLVAAFSRLAARA